MGDVVPFFLVLVIVAATAVVLMLARTRYITTLGSRLPSTVTSNPERVIVWSRLLHDYDEVIQSIMSDNDIRPLLPKETQQKLRDLHVQFRENI